MNQPMLVSLGNGHWGLVTEKKEIGTSRSLVEMRLMKRNDTWTYFELELSYDALNGRKVKKALWLKTAKSINRGELTELCQKQCEAVGRAQTRARQIRQRRTAGPPMPRAVAQAAVREIFPEDRPTKAQWLARVRNCPGLPKSFREALEEKSLIEYVQAKDHAALREYLDRKKMPPAGTQKCAINLFLFSHWQTITQPGMTAEKVHALAVKKLGPSIVGDLAAFQKFLHRRGIRFRPPGRPNK